MVKRATKASSKTASTPTTRALEHGEKAAGARQKKPGFCFAAEDDLAFALGFPYMKFLVDDEHDPRAIAEQLLTDGYPYPHVSYGRDAATRVVRVLCLSVPALDMEKKGTPVRPEAAKVLKRKEPMTPEEARESLLSRFADADDLPPSPMTCFTMEALVGPDVVAAAMLEGLESVPAARWIAEANTMEEPLDNLCLMSLRLLPADRERMLVRLRALRARLKLPPAAAEACDFDVIDGAEIVDPPRPIVQAKPDTVRAARLGKRSKMWYTLPDPRVVFLGGEETYRVELKLWPKYIHPTPPAEAQRIILERFGRIRSPVTVELALDMMMRSRAKVQAKDWLLAHLDYARPILDRLAKSAAGLGKDARAFVDKLPS